MDAQGFLRAANNSAFLFGGFFAGLAFSEQNGSIAWIREWQTLAAGVLAVFAAFITVAAMQNVDRKQQVRHEDLMKLNLRRDRLRVRRAASHSDWLEDWLKRLAELLPNRAASISVPQTPEGTEFVRRLSRLIGELSRIPYINEIEETKDLFEPPMARRYAALVGYSNNANGLANRLVNSLGSTGGGPVLPEADIDAGAKAAIEYLLVIEREIEPFKNDLLALRDAYG